MEQRTVNKLFTNYRRIVRPVSTQKVVHAFISENNNTQMSPEKNSPHNDRIEMKK